MRILNNPVGFYTLFKRESARFMKVYLQTIASPIVTNLLYLAIFGVTFQGRYSPLEGVNYLQFLVPGLIMMGMLTNAFQNSSSSIVIQKYQNTITNLLVIPVSSTEITLAFMLSSMLRGAIVGVVTLITSLFFIDLSFAHIPVLLITTILVSGIFGLLGTIVALWAPDFDKLSIITNFVITPLAFLGGVFYSVSSLPEPFARLSAWNPLVYMIDSLRYGFLGVSEMPIMRSMIILSVLLMILFSITHWAFRTGYKLKS